LREKVELIKNEKRGHTLTKGDDGGIQQDVKTLEYFWPALQRVPFSLCMRISKGLNGGGEKVSAEANIRQMGKVGEKAGEEG
jgi:hypothetical protein